MSRKPFDDVLNVRYGPGTVQPLDLRFSTACVVVNAYKEVSETFIDIDQASYIICGTTRALSAGTIYYDGWTLIVDLSLADVFELQSDPGVLYSFHDIQYVTPNDPARPYYRIWFAPYPF